MSKFKHGDEVWVKGTYDEYDTFINQHYVYFDGNAAAWLKFGAKIFPASEIERLDVWELAARVVALPEENFKEVFGEDATILGVFRHNHPLDVKQKLDLYEQSKIQMGDLVEWAYCGKVLRGIFVGKTDLSVYIMIPGYECVQEWPARSILLTKIEHNVINILGVLDNIKKSSEESEDKR